MALFAPSARRPRVLLWCSFWCPAAFFARPAGLSRSKLVLKTFSIFSGNCHRGLAEAICRHLETQLGQAHVTRFADGEVYVEILENIRGVNCFVIQPTSTP